MSADGEQVEDDADRIHKRAEDLEQFIKDTLLGAKGSRGAHLSTSSLFQILPAFSFFSVSIFCVVTDAQFMMFY